MIKRNRTSELVVKPRYTRQTQFILLALVSLALAAVVVGVYRYGLTQSGFEFGLASEAQSRLKGEIYSLRAEKAALEEALARAQRGEQMNSTTYGELEANLKRSSLEVARLREELNFYRNIISPVNKQAGVRIQNLYINKTDKPGFFRYKLVVIQALNHDRQIYGRARFEITGLQNGEKRVIRINKTDKGREISINFKYFQDIKGHFNLPPAFSATHVKVFVATRGASGRTLEKAYDWKLTH